MFPDLIYYDTDLGFALADCQQTVMWATHNTPWFDQLWLLRGGQLID